MPHIPKFRYLLFFLYCFISNSARMSYTHIQQYCIHQPPLRVGDFSLSRRFSLITRVKYSLTLALMDATIPLRLAPAFLCFFLCFSFHICCTIILGLSISVALILQLTMRKEWVQDE